MGGKSSTAVRYPWFRAVHWQISTSSCARAGTCCFAPDICSLLPWWLGFTRAAGNRQIKYDGGEVRAAWDVGTKAPMPLIHAAVIPELAGSLGGIDAGTLPPRGFIESGGLQLPGAVVASEKTNIWRQSTRPAEGQIHAPFPCGELRGKTRIRIVVQTLIAALAVACCAWAWTQGQRACARLKEHRFPFAADARGFS